jgi:hypothetical protein
MRKYCLKDMGLGSFVVLSVFIALAWGLAIGIIVFLGSFLSDSIGAMMPGGLFGSVPGGVVMLFLIPAAFASAGVVMGCISYPFFKAAVHVVSGINLECEMKTGIEPVESSAYQPMREPARVPTRSASRYTTNALHERP